MSVLRYAVVLLAIVAMAWPSAPPKARGGLAGSEWRIIGVGGVTSPGAARPSGTIRFTQTSIRGKGPCNTYVGSFRENQGGIEIGGINETRMHCAGRMELERAFLDGLARARSYRFDGGTLLLMDADGKPMVRLAG